MPRAKKVAGSENKESFVERVASSSEVAVASSDQGAEPSWPRIFHCDLSEEADLPLLAEPRLGAEQVDKRTYFTGGGCIGRFIHTASSGVNFEIKRHPSEPSPTCQDNRGGNVFSITMIEST